MTEDAAHRRRTGRFARPSGPGYAPWPRHMVVRVNDIVERAVAGPAAVESALAARGIPVGPRTVEAGVDVRAVLSTNSAGTVITLEQRTSRRHRRAAALRDLARTLGSVMDDLGASPGE